MFDVEAKDTVGEPPRFPKRRQIAEAADSARPRVVGSQTKHQIAVEPAQQRSQIARARLQVPARVVEIVHVELLGRSRHYLHQADRPARRYRPGIEAGFDLDDRRDQQRVEPVTVGRGLNLRAERNLLQAGLNRVAVCDADEELEALAARSNRVVQRNASRTNGAGRAGGLKPGMDLFKQNKVLGSRRRWRGVGLTAGRRFAHPRGQDGGGCHAHRQRFLQTAAVEGVHEQSGSFAAPKREVDRLLSTGSCSCVATSALQL